MADKHAGKLKFKTNRKTNLRVGRRVLIQTKIITTTKSTKDTKFKCLPDAVGEAFFCLTSCAIIAAEVVRALHTNLLHGLSPQAQEVDPETYRLYLQAQYLFNQRTLESISAGEKTIHSALQIDSTYAAAWL